VWQYIEREGVDIRTIDFAHERDVFLRDGMWLAVSEFVEVRDSETVERRTVCYRTVGDASCTGAVLSHATDLESIIAEGLDDQRFRAWGDASRR
jgi:sulfate adenylyltransferase subunit 2